MYKRQVLHFVAEMKFIILSTSSVLMVSLKRVLKGIGLPFTFASASSSALKFLKEADFPCPEYPRMNTAIPIAITSLYRYIRLFLKMYGRELFSAVEQLLDL